MKRSSAKADYELNKMLEISNLHAKIGDKEILKGINLTIRDGETHAIMGPNGSGKSTLSAVLVGNPLYEVTEGEVTPRTGRTRAFSSRSNTPWRFPGCR